MPRKTEIIQAEENAVSSPLRRSSRIIQKETKSESIILKDDPIPSRSRSRRASIETASPLPQQLLTSTPRKRRSSVTVESQPPLNQAEPSVEQEKKQTRSRKKSVEPIEVSSKPATRSRRPSVEDEVKEEPKTPKRGRRRNSIDEDIKVIEVIEEVPKRENKLDVIKEGGEEDEAVNDFVEEEISKLGVVKLSPGRASPLFKRTSPGSRLYLPQLNLTDAPVASESGTEKRISDVFQPKNVRCSFSEPMEVDSTLVYADQTFSTPQCTKKVEKLEISTENTSVIVIEDDVSIRNTSSKEPSQAPEDRSCFIVEENNSGMSINEDVTKTTKEKLKQTIENDEKLETMVESVEEKETVEPVNEIEISSANGIVPEEPIKNESFNQVDATKTFEIASEVSFTKKSADETPDEQAKSDQEENKSMDKLESSSRTEHVPAETVQSVDAVKDFEKKMNETESTDDIQEKTVEPTEEPDRSLSPENIDESVNKVGNSPGTDKIEEQMLEETIESESEVQSDTTELIKKVDSCTNLADDEHSELDIDENAIKMAEKECQEELKKAIEQNETTVQEVTETESPKKVEESCDKEVSKSTERTDREVTEEKKLETAKIENIPAEIVESLGEVEDFEEKITEAKPTDDVQMESVEEPEQSISAENTNEVANLVNESVSDNGKFNEDKNEIKKDDSADNLENTLEDKLLDNTYSNNKTLPLDEFVSNLKENETSRNENEKKAEESKVEYPEKIETELMEVSYADETEASLSSNKLENETSEVTKQPIETSDLELVNHSINEPEASDEMSKKNDISQDYEFNLPSDDDTSMLEKSMANENNLTEGCRTENVEIVKDINIKQSSVSDILTEKVNGIENEPRMKRSFEEISSTLNDDAVQATTVDIENKENHTSDMTKNNESIINEEIFDCPKKKIKTSESGSDLNNIQHDTPYKIKDSLDSSWLVQLHPTDSSKSDLELSINSPNKSSTSSPKKKSKKSEFQPDLSNIKCDTPNKIKDSLDSSWLVLPGTVKPSTTNVD